jgi:hypothetical protein
MERRDYTFNTDKLLPFLLVKYLQLNTYCRLYIQYIYRISEFPDITLLGYRECTIERGGEGALWPRNKLC